MNNLKLRTKPIWTPFIGIFYLILPASKSSIRLRSQNKLIIPGAWGTSWFLKWYPNNKLRWKLDANIFRHRNKYNKRRYT